MSKEIYISSTPHETRLAIVEDEALTEIYYERENEYTLAGSIYNGRVTRVLPGMQSSFVDIGLERDAFLYITDFMEETPDPDEFDTVSTGDRAPRPAVSGERPEAVHGSDRGDRGNRGRRGGRDRNQDRNADRTPAESSTSFPLDPAPRVEETPAAASTMESGDTAEIGEGAPGADGGRRWRGRRGRRRGRGPVPGQPGDPAQENAIPAAAEADAPAAIEPYAEIDGETTQPPSAPSDRTDDSYRSGERGRRDRGRGGQRSDLPRYDQDESAPRAPRGFTPSRDLYGVDSGETSGTGPIANAYPESGADGGPEPLILPGETLSKYRKDADVPAPAAKSAIDATPITLAPPANLYTVAAGWDGGDVLPGETLSRRRPESRSEPQRNSEREPRREGRGDREGRGGRDNRSDRGDRQNRSEFRNAPPPPPVPEQPVAVSVAEYVSPPPPPMPGSEPVPEAIQTTPIQATAPEAIAAPEPPPVVEVEYEPEAASASYRVDPVAPSEFRQSAPVLEASAETEAVPAIVPEPEAHAVPAHDITSITPTGEMLSEPAEVLPDATPHTVPVEVPQLHSALSQQSSEVVVDAGADLTALAEGVATGSGQLEEETLDEEDGESATLHASSVEELEDLDEEVLEGAADLGTMLREMSIDHITRSTPEAEELDEEDDLEEDDLEEDGETGDFETFEQSESDEASNSEEFSEEAARTGNPSDQEFFETQFGQSGDQGRSESGEGSSAATSAPRRDSGRGGRRDGRRDGRRGRSDHGDRSSSSGDRDRSGHSGGGGSRGRHSVQSTNLPAISDLLKPGQEILVQIAKEPIAKKGARITSHIALPGRFLVFMPTVNHTGVSRKIESDGERRRLKEILLSEKGDASGGFIVRTAAEGASEEELRSDLRFLLNLWADIKNRSESSKSPALIYHDLNLVERILRDQVTDTFSAIWVDTEDAYERVLRFLQRFQPSLIRRVKLYSKDTPLFEQFGITEEINKALRSKVWLKSGGSIVINQTEALVAIDINTGKFVGKTARLEDTIVKTNLDAIPEIVRQIRLRDLGGIIIIDFIDMDERKNRNRVMAALEDELKSDRAPSKVLQFNDFGLVAITRKRVKQSLERTLSTTCGVCQGTGMVKSPVTVCNDIYIEMRKMHKLLDRGDVMLRVHPEVVKQLKSSGAKWLQEMEEMVGKTILVKSDPSLHPEQFDIH